MPEHGCAGAFRAEQLAAIQYAAGSREGAEFGPPVLHARLLQGRPGSLRRGIEVARQQGLALSADREELASISRLAVALFAIQPMPDCSVREVRNSRTAANNSGSSSRNASWPLSLAI